MKTINLTTKIKKNKEKNPFKRFKEFAEKINTNVKKKILTASLYVLMTTCAYSALHSCGEEVKPKEEISDVINDTSVPRDIASEDIIPKDINPEPTCKNENLAQYIREPEKKYFNMVCNSCDYDFGILKDSKGKSVEKELQEKGTEFIRYLCLFESQKKMEEVCVNNEEKLKYVIATNKLPDNEKAVYPPAGISKTNSIDHWILPIDQDTLEIENEVGCVYHFEVRSDLIANYIPSYYTYNDFFWLVCQAGAIGNRAPDSSPKIYRCKPPCEIVMNGVYGKINCVEKICCDYFKEDPRKNEICEAVISVKVVNCE